MNSSGEPTVDRSSAIGPEVVPDASPPAPHRRAGGFWRRPLIRYTAPPSRQTVSIVMVILGTFYLAVPFCLIAVLFYHPSGVDGTYLALCVLAAALALLANIRDVRGFRSDAWARYSTWYNLVELCLGFTGAVLLSLAFQDRLGMFRPLVFLVLLLMVVIFDGPALVLGWVLSLVALATMTWQATTSLEQTFWVVFVYGAVWGISAASVHYLVRRLFFDLDGSAALADFATESGHASTWSGDVRRSLPTLAHALDVDRVAVALRVRGGEGEQLITWPADWITAEEFDRVPIEPAEGSSTGLSGVRGASAEVQVTLVAPVGRTLLRTPLDDWTAVTAVNLLAGVAERLTLIDRLNDLARTDALTGLANRRALMERFEHELVRAGRTRQPLSVAILDLDHFKQFNDRFGHQAGDDLLHAFATRLGERVRRTDVVARYGGEEFCLVLPDTEGAPACALLDGLRDLGLHDPAGRPVTFSAGVASWDGCEPMDGLLKRADDALYEAKEGGRDRVAAAPTPVAGRAPGDTRPDNN